MGTRLYLFLLIFLLTSVSASCTNSQVDINSGTLIELDKLTGIGPAKGQAIIDSRPFSSVDDLIDVYGIGEATLEKIKLQGLACVENEINNDNEEKTEKTLESVEDLGPITGEIIPINTNENVINLNNDQEEEIVIYESKNEKVNKNLLVGFFVFFASIIYILIK